MNWKTPGRVTWTAPCRVALAKLPVLAAGVLGVALANPDRGPASPLAVSLVGAGFLVLQSVYLRQVRQTR